MNDFLYYHNDSDAEAEGKRLAIVTKMHTNGKANLTVFADGKILFRKLVNPEFMGGINHSGAPRPTEENNEDGAAKTGKEVAKK